MKRFFIIFSKNTSQVIKNELRPGANDIKFDCNLIKTVDIKSGNLMDIVRGIIKSGAEFDGIFAFSDILAFEIMAELKKYGKKYEKIPIIGFDNVMEDLILPLSMATIAVKGESLAGIAFDRLTELMQNRKKTENKSPLEIKIISDVEVIEY